MKTTKILLIRHGKTKGNCERRYVGRTDEALCEKGRMELYRLREALQMQGLTEPTGIYTSPMIRCTESAQVLFPGRRLIAVADLRERDFGAFEYKNYEDLNGNPVYQAFIDSGGRTDFPDAESLLSFKKRCVGAFFSCVRGIQIQTGTPWYAFVVHGGTIMAILEEYALPRRNYFDWQIPNAYGLTAELQVDETNGAIQLVNIEKTDWNRE